MNVSFENFLKILYKKYLCILNIHDHHKKAKYTMIYYQDNYNSKAKKYF